MSEDEFTKLFKHMNERFDKIDKSLSEKADKRDMKRVFDYLDKIAKHQELMTKSV